MTQAAPREALAAAERAYALVQSQPGRAHALAEEAVALARTRRDAEALAAALHALGYARSRLGDPRAYRTMRQAVRYAERQGLGDRAARARRNVALYLAYRGKPALAVAEIDAACDGQSGLDRARSQVFRVAVYHLAGRVGEVLPESAAALELLRRRGEKAWEARLAYNRGAALAEIGRSGPARRDLERAETLYAELGYEAAVADVRIELALLAALEGDAVRCLAELDAVDVAALTDWAAAWFYLYRAEALLGLRLLPEARADLARFVEVSARVKADDSLTKARLQAARLALAAGDAAGARALAAGARRSFAARGQRAFAALARVVELRAGTPSRAAVRRAAAVLEAHGQTLEALRARLLLGEAPPALDRRGTVVDRIELRHVRALCAGSRAGAERQLRRGLALLDEHRATLGSVELRATASALGVELARDGLRLALADGSPERVLEWAERLRANALRLPAVRPPADPELRAAQAELRAVTRRIESGAPFAALRARLEQTIRERSRLVRSDGAAPRVASVASLGSTALVEYVELDGRLVALTAVEGELALDELDPAAVDELAWLRFALGRLAHGRGGAAMRANAEAAAKRLDRALVEPLLPSLADEPLLVVPTGPLHALPWGALPSLRGRAVTVAPSLASWAAARRPSRSRRVALVAGPQLRHARREAEELADVWPGATVLTGPEATADAVLHALDGAAIGHVACHGRFRVDSPLFSSLELADGALTALDLQSLRRAPDVLVHSACDVALSERHAGDELLGLAAVLLGLGTRTIVASVVPVPDRTARSLVLALHRELHAGATPSVALARAQSTLRRSSPLAGFVCLGRG
jgi:hypothetical protein